MFKEYLRQLGVNLPEWSFFYLLSDRRMFAFLPRSQKENLDGWLPPGSCFVPDKEKVLRYAAIRVTGGKMAAFSKVEIDDVGTGLSEGEVQSIMAGLNQRKGEKVIASGSFYGSYGFPAYFSDYIEIPYASSWIRDGKGNMYPEFEEPEVVGVTTQSGKGDTSLLSFQLSEFLEWNGEKNDVSVPVCRKINSSTIDLKHLKRGCWHLMSWGTDERLPGDKKKTATLWFIRLDEEKRKAR